MKTARQFYEGLLGQTVELDHGECVNFTGGFALWQLDHASHILYGKEKAIALPGRDHHWGELYFETDDIEEVYAKVAESGAALAHGIREQPWGQRVFRLYDPDGHIVEIGEPLEAVARRFLKLGLPPEEVSTRISMPLEFVKLVAGRSGE